MSTDKPFFPKISGGDLRFAVVAARYNNALVEGLIRRVLEVFKENGVGPRNVELRRVPGSAELPYVANMLAATGQFDCVIALGVIVSGDTMHDKVIAHSTATALASIGFSTEVPVINGVLTVNDDAQAKERVFGKTDRGAEFAQAALEMARHKIELIERLDAIEAEEEAREDGNDDFDPEKFFKSN